MENTLSRQEVDQILANHRQDFLNRLSEKVEHSQPTTKTTRDLTYYVRAGGDDSASGLRAGEALASIQEAIDRLPDTIVHDVLIDVGEGTFNAFCLQSKNMLSPGLTGLTVRGVLGNPTLTTGTVSGTATAGDKLTLTDSGQSWTVNELRGMLLLVDGEHRVIRENTATKITVVPSGFSANTNGKTYEIVEQKTKIEGAAAGWDGNSYGSGGEHFTGLFYVENLHFDGTGQTLAFYTFHVTGAVFCRRCKSTNGYYGMYSQNVGPYGTYIERCYAEGATDHGIMYTRMAYRCSFDGSYAYNNGASGVGFYGAMFHREFNGASDNNGDHGFHIAVSGFAEGDQLAAKNNGKSGLFLDQSVPYMDLDKGWFESNGEHGISLGGDSRGNSPNRSALGAAGTIECKNNTLSGIHLAWGAAVNLTTCTGTGNGRYGIEFDDDALHASCRITSATTVTGTSGDVTLDGGSTAKSYAGDFGSNLDAENNPVTLAVIQRSD